MHSGTAFVAFSNQVPAARGKCLVISTRSMQRMQPACGGGDDDCLGPFGGRQPSAGSPLSCPNLLQNGHHVRQCFSTACLVRQQDMPRLGPQKHPERLHLCADSTPFICSPGHACIMVSDLPSSKHWCNVVSSATNRMQVTRLSSMMIGISPSVTDFWCPTRKHNREKKKGRED